jgi:hypothetical protein
MSWKPRIESQKMLDYAMGKIKSVPYKVSSRWVFYRLVQAGFLSKSAMGKFDYLLSRARKEFYGDWRPDTLTDSIRQADYKGELDVGYTVNLDTIKEQGFYVQLWFEAEAMHEQFEYHTQNYRVSLVPFRGDCSIPLKWEIAKKLESVHSEYKKPIKIFYFGDCDEKGLQILDAAWRDIRGWSKSSFCVERVGLTEEQAKEFGLPENPEKPGNYQWEALEDQHAKRLILGALIGYQQPISSALLERERTIRGKVRASIVAILKEESGVDLA